MTSTVDGSPDQTRHRPVGTAKSPILTAVGLSKQFGGVTALHDVSLEMFSGQVLGIIGPNGAGKTTLFNVLTGFVDSSAGKIQLDGQDVTSWRRDARARGGLVRTFQHPRLFTNLTVEQNVEVACYYGCRMRLSDSLLRPRSEWRARATARRTARSLLAKVRLGEQTSLRPSELPYGSQRRLEVARALATGPRVLLLDEPAAGLGGSEVALLREIMADLRAEGLAIALIDHNVGLVTSTADRIVVLDYGKQVASGTPEEVLADEMVKRVYLGTADTGTGG